MNKREIEIAVKHFKSALIEYKTAREMAHAVDAEESEISLWKVGKKKIGVRIAIEIFRLHGIEPQLLRPDIFAEDVKIYFKPKK